MEDDIHRILMILFAIEDAFILNICNETDRIWWIIMDEMLNNYNTQDNISEQANDRMTSTDERLELIDTIIINR